MINRTPFRYAGSVGMAMVATTLLVLVWGAVGGWHDDWRDYATQTRYSGYCAENPDAAQCDDPAFEMWMFVPWLLAMGSTAASFAISLPIVWRFVDT